MRASIAFEAEVGALRRRDFQYLLAQARSRFGLEVADHSDGGWLSRRHVVRFSGPRNAVTRFAPVLNLWIAEQSEAAP